MGGAAYLIPSHFVISFGAVTPSCLLHPKSTVVLLSPSPNTTDAYSAKTKARRMVALDAGGGSEKGSASHAGHYSLGVDAIHIEPW